MASCVKTFLLIKILSYGKDNLCYFSHHKNTHQKSPLSVALLLSLFGPFLFRFLFVYDPTGPVRAFLALFVPRLRPKCLSCDPPSPSSFPITTKKETRWHSRSSLPLPTTLTKRLPLGEGHKAQNSSPLPCHIFYFFISGMYPVEYKLVNSCCKAWNKKKYSKLEKFSNAWYVPLLKSFCLDLHVAVGAGAREREAATYFMACS